MSDAHAFIPALGHDRLLPLYDPLTRLLGAGAAHTQLLRLASPRPGQRILDVGCGTGSLLLQAAARWPELELTGIAPDPKALARAGRKARRAQRAVQFDRGFAEKLPYPDGHFDTVLSSLMLHHVRPAQKISVLREAHRVLRAGGRLHLLDFAGPDAARGWLGRHLHGNRQLASNGEKDMIAAMREAGFVDAAVAVRGHLRIGEIVYYSASHVRR